jgi:hypothetical protein
VTHLRHSTVNCFALQNDLFDQLVGSSQQRLGDGKAERLRCFEIDDELELGGLLDGETRRRSELDVVAAEIVDEMRRRPDRRHGWELAHRRGST